MTSLQAPEELSDEKIEELRSIFMLFDQNGDETITIKELGTVMRAMGQYPTEAELRAIISEIDADGNGIIEFHEFVDLMSRRPWGVQGSADELRSAFSVFDHESTGKLSMAELRRTMNTMGEPVSDEDLDKMFSNLVTDGDGNVNYDAFIKTMVEEDAPK
ncbi:hypothetical protein LSH36_814g00010 [Paralvinella palmiformis]|uniref:EF-hand domain-containing protein n=1 Tax=Paralvinella palmiformis TaxID=53620 RepID=A0AAD9IZU2_9ANNE|nr:hypothetical protein LSH36_814g00010 [Paralvinella palmiformis]